MQSDQVRAVTERYRHLIETLNPILEIAIPAPDDDARAMSTAAFIVQSASTPAMEMFGAIATDELVGRPLSHLIAFESAYQIEPLLHAARDGVVTEPVIGLVRTLSREPVAVRMVATRWSEDRIGLIFSAISRSEEVASRLRISEQRYGRLFNDVPIALMRVDSRGALGLFAKARDAGYDDLIRYLDDHPDDFEAALDCTRIVDANDRSVEMFGDGTKDSVLCPVRSYYRMVPDAFKRNMAAAFNGARHYSEETVMCGMGGQIRNVLFTICYPDDAEVEGNSFVGMIDIGDRLRTEAELQRTQAEFARAARLSLMGELTASIAHEVMQPLSSITVNSGTALKWLSKEPPEIERAVKRIKRVLEDAERTAAIVHGIRKMASGGMAERSAVDINLLAQDALTFVQDEARSHDVTLKLIGSAGLPYVQGDAVQMQQVVVNLVVNAIQAVDQSGAIMREVELRTHPAPDGGVELTVRDTGPGIAAEHLPRLFDSFFTTKADGVGMGLAICRSIVENHCGTLTLDNADGGGVIARVRFAPDCDDAPVSTASVGRRATPLPSYDGNVTSL
ncbi:ATP-binding protein [Sphingobium sp.]|uniref:PAS domain-containing sensor histidine kinase n=1 Tax=Sphingobium sp. TaxID=1912891 RepID=UPI003B3B004C